MKTKFYINGKKVSKKVAEEKVGKENLKVKIKESKETFMEDPYIENDWMIPGGILTIRFE